LLLAGVCGLLFCSFVTSFEFLCRSSPDTGEGYRWPL